MEKKALADQLRGEVTRSKRDSDMAKGQIGILEPESKARFATVESTITSCNLLKSDTLTHAPRGRSLKEL